ncbi:transketolase family protein [Polynucleobacter sp. AP-Titi-500A-B4]|uniref:transketolase family protein n=1 Tax=Polynucleobacter sp. AP-Titi-500A-B4 TaxID=2576923 RepID=UPI001BFE2417|nr:transketolase C-terminal domain-containing protein [Polynucleobacter sp. AP-Titi-500A-B4]QWE12806.1 transketolase [Polynucleobacter sp. AP-Titi-500A-B4]
MRSAFSNAIVKLAKNDPQVLLLTGDHGYALFDEFRKECPDQYINAGIAEQNMVGMAAGLAKAGFKPIVYGLSAFIPIRVLEQIKLDVAHDDLPVIFIGDGAGFVYSHLGTSHQSTEDIACVRVIPNLSVFSPADAFELTACMESAYQSNSAIYIRMGKSDRNAVHPLPISLKIGDLVAIKKNLDSTLAFIATGSLSSTALALAKAQYPNASVWSVPYIKPINAEQVIGICKQHQKIVTFEEHSIFGGLGSTIVEISSQYSPSHILRIGVEDCFSKHCGSYEYLLKEHGLDESAISKKINRFLKAVF